MINPPKRKPKTAKGARIVLVDDHPLVRERLAEVINRESDLLVCGEADDRHQAMEVIAKTQPTLVIVDLTLKQSNGLELIKDAHARWPSLLMLVVSMHEETLYAERVIRAGARGYITKQEATRSILQGIRSVLGGNLYLNEQTSSQIIARLTAKPGAASSLPSDILADRELQVFELTGRGLGTSQIAQQLCINVKTVETYRARIKQKLQLKDSDELRQLAIRWNHTR